jgi:hypothetical protein
LVSLVFINPEPISADAASDTETPHSVLGSHTLGRMGCFVLGITQAVLGRITSVIVHIRRRSVRSLHIRLKLP